MDGIRGKHNALGHLNEPGPRASQTAQLHAAPPSEVQEAAAAAALTANQPIASDSDLKTATDRVRTAIQSGTQPPPFSSELRLGGGGSSRSGADKDGDNDGGRDDGKGAGQSAPDAGKGLKLNQPFHWGAAKFKPGVGAGDNWLRGQATAAAQQHNDIVKSAIDSAEPDGHRRQTAVPTQGGSSTTTSQPAVDESGGLSGVAVTANGSAGTVT